MKETASLYMQNCRPDLCTYPAIAVGLFVITKMRPMRATYLQALLNHRLFSLAAVQVIFKLNSLVLSCQYSEAWHHCLYRFWIDNGDTLPASMKPENFSMYLLFIPDGCTIATWRDAH